jgi:mono/diheme cytochrome c family protein
LAAWQATKDERYLKGAGKAYARLNEKFWDERSGLYRTRLGDDTVTLSPKAVAAAVGALREMTFALEPGTARSHLERFVRFWVQAVDVSGFQMAENYQTGELAYGNKARDEDGDGIPFVGRAHGRHGVAPIAAHTVYVNIGGKGNAAFAALEGEAALPAGAVRYAYRGDGVVEKALAAAVPTAAVAELPRTIGVTDLRAAGETAREDSKKGGEELFRLNCAVCHGARGQGITGKPLAPIARDGGMRAVVVDGRPLQRMPHWGRVLAAGEIGRIVEYVEGLFGK